MAEPPVLAQHLCEPSLAAARLLGQRTAELHVALAAEREDPNFAPEPFVTLYRHSLYQSMRKLTLQVFGTLRASIRRLPDTARATAEHVLEQEQEVLRRSHGFLERPFTGMRIRCHGDYHLGQVLCTPDNNFVIIDFEGEPARSIGERRLKHSPIKDVAGMIRSLHYVAHMALPHQAEPWAMFWYSWVVASFLKAYLHVASHSDFLPQDREELGLLLDLHLLEKALCEIDYEIASRPDWVHVPLQGLMQLLS
jgi:maltose alpha-D-glucosyltransferase/alpha-amylase